MDTLATLLLSGASGLAEDKYVMTFAFTAVPDHLTATNLGLAGALYGFITNTPTGALVPMRDFLSDVIPRDPAISMQAKLYDISGHLDGSPHGSPYYVHPGALIADLVTGQGLPSEVACKITLEATGRAAAAVETGDGSDPGSALDRPKSRLTGGVFFGPLNDVAIEYEGPVAGVTGGIPRVSNSLRDTARLAISKMRLDAYDNAGGSQLGVWSRRNAAVVPLEAVSIDNAFDTIRSRGEKPSLRERTALLP